MRIVPLGVSRLRYENEINRRSQTACTRLTLEIKRATMRAKSKLAMLGKESKATANKATTRLLAIQLIQDHNRVDVLNIVHRDISLIGQNSSKLTSKTRLDDALHSSIATIICASSYLDLYEVKELVEIFRELLGEKFVASAASNKAKICNERVVTKLTLPIEEALIQQYLHVVTQHSGTANQAIKPTAPKFPTDTKAIRPVECPKPLQPCNGRIGPIDQLSTSDQTVGTTATVSFSKFAPSHPIHIFRPNKRLEIAFDGRTKNPVYVMERLLAGREKTASTTRRHNFYEDLRLPPEFRSRLVSFLHSGWDRGHMAPAADFGSGSVKDTFNLCNVSPQDRTMNRSIWFKLEHWCRRVAERELVSRKGVAVHVVTGPVWMPKKNPSTDRKRPGPHHHHHHHHHHHFEFMAIGNGDSLIHVPTHFFKVIVVSRSAAAAAAAAGDDDDEPIQKFACFLVPNEKAGKSSRLEEFVIHWDRLESITGLQFFPKLVTPAWKDKARKATRTMMTETGSTGAGLPIATTTSKPAASKVAVSNTAAITTQLQHLKLDEY